MEIGIIGLGKMGGNLALQCIEKGIRVVGKARRPKPELTKKGVKVVQEYDEFVGSLKPPQSDLPVASRRPNYRQGAKRTRAPS